MEYHVKTRWKLIILSRIFSMLAVAINIEFNWYCDFRLMVVQPGEYGFPFLSMAYMYSLSISLFGICESQTKLFGWIKEPTLARSYCGG